MDRVMNENGFVHLMLSYIHETAFLGVIIDVDGIRIDLKKI